MNSRASAWWVNGALAVCAVLALFPLFWMLSVSLMQPGEANNLPPPMLPSTRPSPITANCSRTRAWAAISPTA